MKKLFSLLSLPLLLAACLNEQVADSSATLPSNHPPVDGGGSSPSESTKLAVTTVSFQLGGREFMISNLRNIFLSSTTAPADVTAFETILNQTIQTAPQVFGGALNLYSTLGLKETTNGKMNSSGSMSNDDDDKITPFVESTPARTALLGDACRRILGNDVFMSEALKKIGVLTPEATPLTSARIADLMSLFRIGYDAPVTLTSAYVSTIQVGASTGTAITLTEQWRMALDLVCEDPYWQAL